MRHSRYARNHGWNLNPTPTPEPGARCESCLRFVPVHFVRFTDANYVVCDNCDLTNTQESHG